MNIYRMLAMLSIVCLIVVALSCPVPAHASNDFGDFTYVSISLVKETYSGASKTNLVTISGDTAAVGPRELHITGINTTLDPNPNETAETCLKFAQKVMEAPQKFQMEVKGSGGVVPGLDPSSEVLTADVTQSDNRVTCALVPTH